MCATQKEYFKLQLAYFCLMINDEGETIVTNACDNGIWTTFYPDKFHSKNIIYLCKNNR